MKIQNNDQTYTDNLDEFLQQFEEFESDLKSMVMSNVEAQVEGLWCEKHQSSPTKIGNGEHNYCCDELFEKAKLIASE